MTLTGTTNTAAATALRYLAKNNTDATNSLSKLSSGSRIVRASDDAASLAVGTKIKADVTALKQAQVNAGQASSLLQVADGGLSQVSDILMRMKALSVQAQSGSVGDTERGFLDKEFQALAKQIDAIGDQTKFNNTVLLGGNLTASFSAIGTAIDGSGSVELKATSGAQAGDYTVTYDHTTGDLTVQQGSGAGAKAQTVTLDDTDTSYTGNVSFAQFGLEVDLKNVDLSAAGSDISSNNTATVANGSLSFQVGCRLDGHDRRQHQLDQDGRAQGRERHLLARRRRRLRQCRHHRNLGRRGPRRRHPGWRHRPDERRARGCRRADVPLRLRVRQSRDLERESRRGALDPDGRRHGLGDEQLHLQAGADAGIRGDAGAGEPDAAVAAPAAPVGIARGRQCRPLHAQEARWPCSAPSLPWPRSVAQAARWRRRAMAAACSTGPHPHRRSRLRSGNPSIRRQRPRWRPPHGATMQIGTFR